MKFLYRLLTVSGVVFGLAGGSAVAHEVLNFEEDVGPILQKNCGGAGCHMGAKTSGAEFTSFETLMLSVGAQYGSPLVVPGRPELSPLIDKISSVQPRFGVRMPLGATPLSDQEVNALRQWVRDGAVDRHLPRRGDVDQNEQLNLTDAVSLLNFLFSGGNEPECLALANADSAALSVNALVVDSAANASTAIAAVDAAIDTLNSAAQTVGESLLRLSSKEDTLSVAITNTEAARSRIEDADFAAEQANLVRNQIIQQTAFSAFAQANAAPQLVLSLFR